MSSVRHLQRYLSTLPSLRQSARPSRSVRSLWTSGSSFKTRSHAGVSISIALTLALTAYTFTSSSIHLDATPLQHVSSTPLLSSSQLPQPAFHIDPASSQKIPMTIPPPASLAATSREDLVLVASGIRTVSFLRVQVYVAALYVSPSALEDFIKGQKSAQGSQRYSLEQTMKQALEAGMPIVLKIIPVKNTDFSHLRDGFARAVQSRYKLLLKSPSPPTEKEEKSLSLSLQKLKDCFPKAFLKKGEHLDLVFSPSRVTAPAATATAASNSRGVDLTFEYVGVVLGSVQYDKKGGNLDVARLLFQAYVADKDPVSEAFKKAVSQKLLSLLPSQ